MTMDISISRTVHYYLLYFNIGGCIFVFTPIDTKWITDAVYNFYN